MNDKMVGNLIVVTIIGVLVLIAAAESEFAEENSLQSAGAAVELSGEELANFYHYQELVELALKKAAESDGDPTDLSYQDQKNLLKSIGHPDKGPRSMLVEGYPLSLKARKPQGIENLPGIYLKTSPDNEIFVHYSVLLRYTGYEKLGDWIEHESLGY